MARATPTLVAYMEPPQKITVILGCQCHVSPLKPPKKQKQIHQNTHRPASPTKWRTPREWLQWGTSSALSCTKRSSFSSFAAAATESSHSCVRAVLITRIETQAVQDMICQKMCPHTGACAMQSLPLGSVANLLMNVVQMAEPTLCASP